MSESRYMGGLREELRRIQKEKQMYNNSDNTKTATLYVPKIINGSTLSIGDKLAKTQLKADQHFNWFQKLMWKWCFGVKVEDYSEE